MRGAIDGMARAICAAPHDPDDVATSADEAVREYGVQAAAAWAYALATLSEPSEAMKDAAFNGLFRRMSSDHDRPMNVILNGWVDMLDAFAAEHGIELPQEPASPEQQG